MVAKPLPSQAQLRVLFNYDPLTGELTWQYRPAHTFNTTPLRSAEHQARNFNNRFAGKPAFTSRGKNGYLRGTINHEFFYAHRVIWKWLYGTDPDHIDHEDGNRINNRQNNLVDASREENARNRRLSTNNTSGHHGVTYSRRHKLWSAVIYHQNQSVHLGWFKDKHDAINARKTAEIMFGYHRNHGRP